MMLPTLRQVLPGGLDYREKDVGLAGSATLSRLTPVSTGHHPTVHFRIVNMDARLAK